MSLLFHDWSIKTWDLHSDGSLDYITYSSTWKNEQGNRENLMRQKTAAFMKSDGRIHVKYGDPTPEVSFSPIYEVIETPRRSTTFPN